MRAVSSTASPDRISRSPHRRKKKKKKAREIFNIPGVCKVTLSELAQRFIGCVAGEHVTSENPWMYVKREFIVDNMELYEANSEFAPIRCEIALFPKEQYLIGYIPDDTKDVDEFYLCYSDEAEETVLAIIQKMKAEQDDRLNNAINKKVKKWTSLGTEAEVEESIYKNNRPLLEVEVESKYPIAPTKGHLKTVGADQRRDGYMELKCTDIVNVHKKRIHGQIQAAPALMSHEAQTTCAYPSNSGTQYLYEYEDSEILFEQCKIDLEEFTSQNYENISDKLTVNGAIDFYSDDFSALEADSKFTKTSSVEEVKEYMSFVDVNNCRGKMIADAVWHPMWTGTVAIAYADAAPNIFHTGQSTEDNVLRSVHGLNPVLIWSCLDGLRAKLILEAPREVHKLAFCKFDENILIGGCKNGQIIIWDIRNKLNKVEELEILTNAQQKYRTYMHSLMGWMKNVHDLSLVRPTVISDLRYSHKGPITAITWLSPYYHFSKIGNLREIPEEVNERSMQFLTSSEDGTTLIWDLLTKSAIQPGGFRLRKLRRLKKRPSALMVDVSPFRSLHLNLKPIYRINLARKDNNISSCYANFGNIKYEEVNPDENRKILINDRIFYKPIFKRNDQEELKSKVHIGTMQGDYIILKWDGQDFDSGEVVNSESGVILSAAKYHDGPVNTVQASDASNVILTVGGRIFALWREDFPGRPILWRRNKHMYTSGEWNIFQPYVFTNKIMNGEVESWMMFAESKLPLFSLTFSSKFLTASAIHPIQMKKTIYGAGDKQGSFRMFFMPEDTTAGSVDSKTEQFNEFIDREVMRKKQFLEWQDIWNKKHASLIKLRDEEQRDIITKEEQALKAKAAQQLEEKGTDKIIKKGPQAGKYVDWIKEQRQLDELDRIKSTIISKKQLDTKELERRRKPLQKLDEENERKKRKQKQRLKEGEAIFQETVSSLFPDVVNEKPAPPPDPYAGGESMSQRERCYYDYIDYIRHAADHFIETHPYHYDFNWRQVLSSGKERRHMLNEAVGVRRNRQGTIKTTPKGSSEEIQDASTVKSDHAVIS